MGESAREFIDKQMSITLLYCDLCREKWYDKCSCNNKPNDFTHNNDMDPLYPTHSSDPDVKYAEFRAEYNDGSPIALLLAIHDNPNTASYSSKNLRCLSAKLFVCVGAKVMLLWNISTTCGLVNGSVGEIKEIHQDYLVIDFESYVGPALFQEMEKRRWVRIFRVQAEIKGYDDGVTHFRRQYPILL
jgi:hypothetical protein